VATHTADLFNGIYEAVRKKVPGLPPELKKPGHGVARAGDLKRSCLNAGKAKREFGWSPEVSLNEGIEKTLNWRFSVL
ncbi:MAG: UDP-glucose 4-epimerase, partial [Deltaproteobacteria bacterium]|nr:UDP-glucose 4-epimerase [Deltaproteobacteria bacterium]